MFGHQNLFCKSKKHKIEGNVKMQLVIQVKVLLTLLIHCSGHELTSINYFVTLRRQFKRKTTQHNVSLYEYKHYFTGWIDVECCVVLVSELMITTYFIYSSVARRLSAGFVYKSALQSDINAHMLLFGLLNK